MLAFLKMLNSIHIDFKHCGKKINSIIVDYTLKLDKSILQR